MIKVFIADDHPLIRKGMKELLRQEGSMEVVGEGQNALEVLEGLSETSVDVLVMDFSMPGRSGFDLVMDVKVRHPHLPILILSMHPGERFAVRAFKAGAAGYITKETAPEEIIRAIRKVAEGRKYITPALAEQLAHDVYKGGKILPHENLSNRELQVLCMIASGKKVKEIAAELHLSFRTINTFRSHTLAKMNMKSNVELTHYAIQNKLID